MAKYLNEDGVGLMLQNINNHINAKLSNYLPKTTPIPDEVELIEISGDMLADEPTYTATEALAILEAYNADKLIALNNSATRNYGNGWFIPSIFVRSLQTIRQIYISGVIANFYIEQHFNYDTSSGSVATVYIDRKLDLSEIGGSSTYAYGTCDTAAGIGTKVVTLTDSNFTVSTGSIVAVKFTNANSVASTSLKLSVAGVTAQIKYLNTTFPNVQHWLAGSIVEFVYDGSAWQVLGTIKDNVGTDTKVNQTITTTNSTYPLLFSATANKGTTSADAARFSSNLKYNPSTNLLTVGGISGYASTTGSYAVCSTAARASTKVISLPNTNLVEGSRFWVQFTTGNTYLGDTNFNITHKGGSLTGLKLYLNGFIGSVSTYGRDNSWQAGINLLPGYYEMLYDGGNLQLTKNFVANRAPEIHVNTGSTIGWTVNNFNLYPDTHIVFENTGVRTLGIYTANFFADRSYSFEVTSNSTVVPTITLPSTLKWANGVFPTFEKSTTYHISIVNNCAVCAGFKTVEPS